MLKLLHGAVLLEVVSKTSLFYGTQTLWVLLCPKQPTTGLYPDPDEYNQFTMHAFILSYNMESFFGVTLPTVWRFSLYKRKSLELWLMHNPELHV